VQRQISALLEEGKALAYKQSEMEKAVRKARGELKGVEQERNSVRPHLHLAKDMPLAVLYTLSTK
jgi:hypothetical protein